MPKRKLDRAEAVGPLLQEYSSLHQEIVAALRSTETLASIAVVLMAGTVTLAYAYDRREVFLVAAPALMLLGSYWISTYITMWYIGRYKEFIERRVNQLSGENLMNWESKYTAAKLGANLWIQLAHINERVFNPVAALQHSAILGLVFVQFFNIAQGSLFIFQTDDLDIVLRSSATAGFSFLLVSWLIGVFAAYLAGRKLVAAFGQSLDEELKAGGGR